MRLKPIIIGSLVILMAWSMTTQYLHAHAAQVHHATNTIVTTLAWVTPLIAVGVGTVLMVTRRNIRRTNQQDRAIRRAHTRIGGVDIDAGARDGKHLEHLVCALLTAEGVNAHVSGGSGDRGADVVGVTDDGLKVVAQCKQYNPRPGGRQRKVTDEQLQAFIGTCFGYHGAHVAVFVTNSYLTEPARELARYAHVLVVDRPALLAVVDGQRSMLPTRWLVAAIEAVEMGVPARAAQIEGRK